MSKRTRKKLGKKILQDFIDNIMSWGSDTLDQFIQRASYISFLGFPLSDEQFSELFTKADIIDTNYHLDHTIRN